MEQISNTFKEARTGIERYLRVEEKWNEKISDKSRKGDLLELASMIHTGLKCQTNRLYGMTGPLKALTELDPTAVQDMTSKEDRLLFSRFARRLKKLTERAKFCHTANNHVAHELLARGLLKEAFNISTNHYILADCSVDSADTRDAMLREVAKWDGTLRPLLSALRPASLAADRLVEISSRQSLGSNLAPETDN